MLAFFKNTCYSIAMRFASRLPYASMAQKEKYYIRNIFYKIIRADLVSVTMSLGIEQMKLKTGGPE